jgi:hypothetical protein
MTADGWRGLVLHACAAHAAGDAAPLARLTQLLVAQDAAKAELHSKGYGVIGTPWTQLVAEVGDARRTR